MSNRAVYFHPQARRDLAEIWFYTFDKWGKSQADAYVAEIRLKVEALPDNPQLGRPWRWQRSGLRVLPARSHIVGYRVTADRIEIARILSSRQDWQKLLGD